MEKFKEYGFGILLALAELIVVVVASMANPLIGIALFFIIATFTLPKAIGVYKNKYVPALDLEKQTNELNEIKQKIELEKQDIENNKKSLLADIENLVNNKEQIQSEIKKLEDDKRILTQEIDHISIITDAGLYPQEFEFDNSESYKAKHNNIRELQKSMIRDKRATTINSKIQVDGKTSKGNSLASRIEKLMLRAFNIQSDILVDQVTYINYETKKKQLIKAYEDVNKLAYENIVMITSNYLDLKLQELEVAYLYKAKLEEEKEILREEHERQKEEAQARKEIQEKQKKIDTEIYKLQSTKERLNEKIENAKNEEIALLREQLAKLEETIAEFEDDKQELDYRLEHTGAGYVYVISNIGSFGERVFKIGVTRRLDPYERIAELSSASVPFRFDVHAMIFSYDAYSLETELHNRFNANRINKVNPRKEFFNVELAEIKKVLDDHKELTFDYVVDPKADEYRESLRLAN